MNGEGRGNACSWNGSYAWYVAYGSNLRLARLRCYLRGGRAPDALFAHPGSRNPADPLDARPVALDGSLCFAGTSSLWGGGIACYHAEPHQSVACRAFLLTVDQIADVIAQETRQRPGADLAVRSVICEGQGALSCGTYTSMVRVGWLDDLPMVTIASGSRPHPAPPSAAYIRSMAAGLCEAYAWTPEEIARYLGAWPGVRGAWSQESLRCQAVEALAAPPSPAGGMAAGEGGQPAPRLEGPTPCAITGVLE